MTETRVILVTAPDREAALDLARRLVGDGLAACGNVVPGITSVFRWEGSVQEDPEALLVLKVHESRVPEIVRRIPELHPYDVPEVLVLGVETGFRPYLDWVASESGVRDEGPGGREP
jgi:periplasmic divalent cation tolerance protein